MEKRTMAFVVLGLVVLSGLVYALTVYDTDGGNVPSVNGTCVVVNDYNQSTYYQDYCVSPFSLREYYPSGKSCGSTFYSCNCRNARC